MREVLAADAAGRTAALHALGQEAAVALDASARRTPQRPGEALADLANYAVAPRGTASSSEMSPDSASDEEKAAIDDEAQWWWDMEGEAASDDGEEDESSEEEDEGDEEDGGGESRGPN